MTDEVPKFSDRNSDPGFTPFDEDTQAWVSKTFMHLKGHFWDGKLPEITEGDLLGNKRLANKIYDLYTKKGSRAALRWRSIPQSIDSVD